METKMRSQSPWELMESRMIGPNQKKLLITLESFLRYRIDNNTKKSTSVLAEYENILSHSFSGLCRYQFGCFRESRPLNEWLQIDVG